MGIGKKIEEMMKKRGTNANELAQKTGLTASTIYSMIQRDSSRVDIDILLKVAHALDITADELISDQAPLKNTLAAHFEGKTFTPDEINDIIRYAEYLKSKRTK